MNTKFLTECAGIWFLLAGLSGVLVGACSSDRDVWAPSCENDEIDGQETDVDCGGPNCQACGIGRLCIVDEDCQSGLRCEDGICKEPACPGGLAKCGDTCVDPQSDRSNCGGCGNACTEEQLCVLGSCVTECPDGLTECDTGSCVDLSSDEYNCGTCGHVCGADQSCEAFICVTSDPEGPGTFQFSSATYSVGESDGNVMITIERTGGSVGTVTIEWRTIGVDATYNIDYVSFSWTMLIFADDETSKTLPIEIISDNDVEADESFYVRIRNPTGGATLGAVTEALVTIIDDDVSSSVCGDGVCDEDESCSTCASDCGACPSSCGDGICATGEDCASCSQDCGTCPSGALPAFPGAEGAGSDTPGGRGGAVCRVTNLADSGEGSLRECLEVRTGPRIVIFDIGGTIELLSMIRMSGETDSYVTVAGQTAPGGGIQLKNYGLLISGVHDLVLRHLRIRPGTANPSGASTSSIDGIQIYGDSSSSRAHHIVIDHCSLQWGLDENASAWNWVDQVTWQYNLIAEPNTAHPMGFLFGAGSQYDTTLEMTGHHNLLAHNAERNPRVHKAHSMLHWVNNLVYNWGQWGRAGYTEGARGNFINNHYIKGPDGPSSDSFVSGDSSASIFLQGNFGPACPTGCSGSDAPLATGVTLVSTPFAATPVSVTPTAQVKDLVRAEAGANRCSIDTFCRDAVDNRIVSEVEAGTGSTGIGPPSTYPTLSTGTPWVDSDGDGMPDAWESQNGFDPSSAADGGSADRDGDGYTNLEEWFNGTAP